MQTKLFGLGDIKGTGVDHCAFICTGDQTVRTVMFLNKSPHVGTSIAIRHIPTRMCGDYAFSTVRASTPPPSHAHH